MFRDIKEPAVFIETAGFLFPNTLQYRPPKASILGAPLGPPWTGGPQNAEARTTADPAAVSLLDARERRDSARQLLAAGSDPARVRDEQARQARMAAANTFEQVAREWHQTMLAQWQPQTARDILIVSNRTSSRRSGSWPSPRSRHVTSSMPSVRLSGAGHSRSPAGLPQTVRGYSGTRCVAG